MERLRFSRASLELSQPEDYLSEDQALQSSATLRLRSLLWLKLWNLCLSLHHQLCSLQARAMKQAFSPSTSYNTRVICLEDESKP